jgi:hypothetical protein
MGLRRDTKRALRVHASTCSTCQAADDYQQMCQEFRDALIWSEARKLNRRTLRELKRIVPRVPEPMRQEAARDLEELREEDRRKDEALGTSFAGHCDPKCDRGAARTNV